jgi:hypothetical protein
MRWNVMRRPSAAGCSKAGREQKNAGRRGAAIVFIDEAGFLMGPLRRRSWAPRGHTPQLHQRGRSRSKVSVIGALVVSPRRRRVRGYFGVLPEANYDGEAVLAFLKQLRRALRVPITVIWAMCVPICCRRTRPSSTPSS